MPDRDIVERRLARPWAKPYRLMKGGSEADFVAEAIVQALPAHLRERGGIPGFDRVLAVCAPLKAPRDARSIAAVTRTIEQDFEQSTGIKLLVRVTQRHLAKIGAGRALPGPLPLVEEYLRTLLRHEFFDRVTDRLIGEGKPFPDARAARQFECELLSILESQLSRIAISLLADPTASNLRAPRSLRRKCPTAVLIDIPITAGLKAP